MRSAASWQRSTPQRATALREQRACAKKNGAAAGASRATAAGALRRRCSGHRRNVVADVAAQRAAHRLDVDLKLVRGTGPSGLILRSDVETQAATARRRSGPPAPPNPPLPAGAKTTPLRGPAAALTGYMEQSLAIPTATSFRTIAVDVLDARRNELNGALRGAGRTEKVSFTHLIAYAMVRAAHELPFITYSFRRDEHGAPSRVESGIHLGLAVDSERKDGTRFLIVPVIRNAGDLDFAALSLGVRRLVARARENKLGADDLAGASFTLTNPGGIGTVASVPRLMPGQGAILAAGAIGYPPGFRQCQRTDAAAARRRQGDADHEHLRSSRHSRRAVGRVSAARRSIAARRRCVLRNGFLVVRIASRTDVGHRRTPAAPAGPSVGRYAARGRGRHGDRFRVPFVRAFGRAARSTGHRTARRCIAAAADLRFDAGIAERDSRKRSARQSAGQYAGRRAAAVASNV